MGIVLCMMVKAQQQPVYLDPNAPLETRVKDLVSRMTLEEKIGQMVYTAPAIPRLGIPEYNWWNEALHGVGRSGVATIFPQAIGLAATFNDSLAFLESSAISDEARAMYNAAVKKDYRMKYGDLPSGHPTSTYSAIRAGAGDRKPMAKILFLLRAWAWHL